MGGRDWTKPSSPTNRVDLIDPVGGDFINDTEDAAVESGVGNFIGFVVADWAGLMGLLPLALMVIRRQ